jgi:hypothetical protein
MDILDDVIGSKNLPKFKVNTTLLGQDIKFHLLEVEL